MINRTLSVTALLCAATALLPGAATIIIVNNDPAGVGFNDPTVAAPVGGNSGTTVGQQRLIAFQAAASKWGATLTSVPIIRIKAQWTALTCTATAAVLGSAGASQVAHDVVGQPLAGTWYSAAETNALTGTVLDAATPEINANFNVNLGQPGCLTGTFFYLGIDNNHAANVDLVSVLTHEFGHGLGFANFTNGNSGAFFSGFPSVWDWFLFDNTTNKLWKDMTNTERAASARNDTHLVWTGTNVTNLVPTVLGTPQLQVSAPATVAGTYTVGTASFGPGLTTASVINKEVMPVVDTAGNLGLACTALNAVNAAAVVGKIAVVDRGTCSFAIKAKIVQDAGALGAIVVNNTTGVILMSGTDPTLTIPSVMISQADGNTLKAALATRSRAHSGMFATMTLNHSILPGADGSNRAMLYAPTTFASGSSVSHYDTRAFPNLLMEPAINVDLTHEVTAPLDLTYPLLKDIGWQ